MYLPGKKKKARTGNHLDPPNTNTSLSLSQTHTPYVPNKKIAFHFKQLNHIFQKKKKILPFKT